LNILRIQFSSVWTLDIVVSYNFHSTVHTHPSVTRLSKTWEQSTGYRQKPLDIADIPL